MKTSRLNKLGIMLALVLTTLVTQDIFAQGPPPWAPAHGYRAKVRHVYFPTQNMYYDIQEGVYIYANGGNWSISASLPSLFRNVNLSTAVQIGLDFRGDYPQRYNTVHVTEYRYYGKEKHKHKKHKHKKHKHS